MADYDEIAKYFDVTTEKMTDYKKEAKQIQSILNPYHVTTIHDIACGTGSHVIELSKLGFRCSGSDLSKNMIEEGKKKALEEGLDIAFSTSDLREVKTENKYDAMLGLYAVGFLKTKEDFKTMLRGIYDALIPGGVFLFNVLNAGFETDGIAASDIKEPVLTMDILADSKELSIVRLSSSAFHNHVQEWCHTYLIQDNGRFKLKALSQKYQMYTQNEIEELLEECGFTVKKVQYEDIPAFHKWDMFVVAQADVKQEADGVEADDEK